MTTPSFSVIIPTKDRAEYLYHSLRTCSLQDYDNLEVIVSDDGSKDNTREVVEEAARKDPRIRYVCPKLNSGMRANFEFALSQVKPGYVLALGGDDGLLPYGIRGMCDVLQSTGQELLAWPTPIFIYPKSKTPSGQLVVYTKGGRPRAGIKIVQSQQFLERQARNLSYLSDVESPMIYVKGVASTRLIENVRRRNTDGLFFSCATPDGYSGIVLAGEVEHYAFSGAPFSIYGASPTSQGAAYLAAHENAQKQSEEFFKNASAKPMHGDLAGQPYSPLISLMTADYLLTARDLPGWPGRFPPIDYRILLSKAVNELAHGLLAETRISRELEILKRIADQHGLQTHLRQRLSLTRRNKKIKPLEGNAISTKNLYLDCTEFGIHNVFDAAYVVHYMHQILPKLGISTVAKALLNSVQYGLRSIPMGARLADRKIG